MIERQQTLNHQSENDQPEAALRAALGLPLQVVAAPVVAARVDRLEVQ